MKHSKIKKDESNSKLEDHVPDWKTERLTNELYDILGGDKETDKNNKYIQLSKDADKFVKMMNLLNERKQQRKLRSWNNEEE